MFYLLIPIPSIFDALEGRVGGLFGGNGNIYTLSKKKVESIILRIVSNQKITGREGEKGRETI